MRNVREMMATQHRDGRIDWLGLRPARRVEMVAVEAVRIGEDGLEGDHGRRGLRAVTLIQAEHLAVISALSGTTATPERLRRNVVVSGINLATLRDRDISLGGAVLQITGPCAPCSRMEETLGPGGYQAVRHHGGWCARVLQAGDVARGAAVST